MGPSEAEALPTELVAGRFFVHPVTTDGTHLRLFTDTGGGLFLYASTVERLGLTSEEVTIGDETVWVVPMPGFRPDASIPPVSVEDDPRHPELGGRLLVMPDDAPGPRWGDGMLGQEWFGGRVWTFDYAAGRLLLHQGPPSQRGRAVPLGFPRNHEGRPTSHFPSIEAEVDGETLAFLFDTGATIRLAERALQEIGGDQAERGTCFVVSSLFERWRQRHPDWRVIEGADANLGGEPIIEVPTVRVADLEAGPVWFTRRADRIFHEWMSRLMDRRVEGALGGSLFQRFAITVDYPRATADFVPAP